MSADPKPPFPLPDLPRAPFTTVSGLVTRWLEWDDWTAAQKLPDALRDAGRDEDAKAVMQIVSRHLHPEFGGAHYRNRVLGLLAWDVYDWNAACERVQAVRIRSTADLIRAVEHLGGGPHMLLPAEPMSEEMAGVLTDGDPAQRLIGFAARLGFVPVAESQTPLFDEAGDTTGHDRELTFRLRTYEDDDEPDGDPTDLYQPGPDDGPGAPV